MPCAWQRHAHWSIMELKTFDSCPGHLVMFQDGVSFLCLPLRSIEIVGRGYVASYDSLKPFPWSNNPALKENTALWGVKEGRGMNRLKAKPRLKQEATVAAFDLLCRFVHEFPVTLCDNHCLHSQHSSSLISSRIIHFYLTMRDP
jgi:hypothetical protein